MAFVTSDNSNHVARSSGLPSLAGFGISLWYYAAAGANGQAIYNLDGAGGEFDFIWISEARVLELQGNGGLDAAGSSLANNSWNHIAYSRAGTSRKVWLNGVLDISDSLGNSYTVSVESIGGYPDTPGAWTTNGGRFANFVGLARELTQADVDILRRRMVPPSPVGTFAPFFTHTRLENLAGGVGFTNSGTLTTADGPPVSWGASPIIVNDPTPLQVDDPLDDSAAATDALTDTLQIDLDVSDSAAASDALASAIELLEAIAASAAASDAKATQVTVQEAHSASASATDAKDSSVTVNEAVGGSADASDAMANSLLLDHAVGESAAATDGLVNSLQLDDPLAESAPAIDSWPTSVEVAQALAESVAATDAMGSEQEAASALAESAGATDAYAAVATVAEPLAETAAASDGLVDTVDGVAADDLPETAAATDGLVTAVSLLEQLGETAAANDDLAPSQDFDDGFEEEAAATDSFLDEIGALPDAGGGTYWITRHRRRATR